MWRLLGSDYWMQVAQTSASLRRKSTFACGAGDRDVGAVAIADVDGPAELDAEAFSALSTDGAAAPEIPKAEAVCALLVAPEGPCDVVTTAGKVADDAATDGKPDATAAGDVPDTPVAEVLKHFKCRTLDDASVIGAKAF